MPVLLPTSAAAFIPRSSPIVVLKEAEPWLTANMERVKRANQVKKKLNNIPQHAKYLTEILSSPGAIWTLCSLMLPKAPDAELKRDGNPLVEAPFNYQMIHVKAYVVHVDMVSQDEVAFKLTPETIKALVTFHQEIYSVDMVVKTWDWPEKQTQLKELQEEFNQATNKFIYRTDARVLDGLEEDGAGELLSGRSEEAKTAIMTLFVPLLPPLPKMAAVSHPAAPLINPQAALVVVVNPELYSEWAVLKYPLLIDWKVLEMGSCINTSYQQIFEQNCA